MVTYRGQGNTCPYHKGVFMNIERNLRFIYLDACYEGAGNSLVRIYYWIRLQLFERWGI